MIGCWKNTIWISTHLSLVTRLITEYFDNNSVVHCFSGAWYGCRVGWFADQQRGRDWRHGRLTVERDFCERETPAAWTVWRNPPTSWVRDQSAGDKTCQQPCTLLRLFDIVISHESAWSVVQSTTQKHSPDTLHILVGNHGHSSSQTTHLAADWLRTMHGVFQYWYFVQ